MTTCVYNLEIPDLSRPIPGATEISPSGELVPFHPTPVDPQSLTGRRIRDVAMNAGTYGMGGPGFCALRLEDDWLVIALWGAASWMTCRGRLIEDLFFDDASRPAPWTNATDSIVHALNNQTIESAAVTRDAMRITISGGYDLTIDADPAARPVFAGNGLPRAFTPDDDLRRAVFLSPTIELWV